MKPALLPDWQDILKYAWSVRLNALAFFFLGAELLLPIYADQFPRHLFALLSLAALAGSMWARLLRQRKLDGEKDQ